ncbi:MAG: putative endonuclease [Parcubacteria group bacterium LiPW_41]|nr:MAG: putative endonuclease [Parcubacteria group bacterium LiPW_41]
MFYVYILKSVRTNELYIGYTTNVVRRLKEHNEGLNKSTKSMRPLQLVYLEGYADVRDARDRERKIKQFGRVYSQLKRRIQRSIVFERCGTKDQSEKASFILKAK